jgi:glycosyltransferase involved in cell wall biosynthesis
MDRDVIMHITVCVCTFRRSVLLERLLWALAEQETQGLFTHSVVVVDNDRERSAEVVVRAVAEKYPLPIIYCVEPEQGIAYARNRAVENAQGDFLAFIDDDECPIREWLLLLFNVCMERKVDGVLGPVKSHFESEPPDWITRGRFYERADYPTGFVINGSKGRTGNVLLRRSLFGPGELAFRPEFVTGEDQDLFRRKIDDGHIFVWCSEAIAYETVPPSRWKRSYILRKALMRGRYSVIEPTFGFVDAAKSVVAIAVYTVALPAIWIAGQHHIMRYLEKVCYHAGKILACARLNPVGREYVSD